MRIRRTEIRRARIEIIPMIDTIFFLLVFFMFTSLSMIHMKGLNTELPRASSAKAAGGQPDHSHDLILTVNPRDRYYLNTTRIDPGSLETGLRSRLAADPNMVVVLNLAKDQNTQTLIRVMDTLNLIRTPDGGAIHALIATEPVDLHGRAVSPAGTGAAHVR
ncbi:MAG TPA: biopolymer transporter ExbD [Armatimonadota bacterium]|nr:biopolymer transporter ExbD [Armatimonadota bacterium]